ncbi:hypothetical protein G210_4850 [Candida maltosa Xu316]|uniref:Uncharacterized protein n=1 Tax=Candida maltosa (strain Xu316) TaxID=1245528 RepID=M3JFK3_CANMX|nr:hypothetical protein G210_4850 [Candida maltosa Xu316]
MSETICASVTCIVGDVTGTALIEVLWCGRML